VGAGGDEHLPRGGPADRAGVLAVPGEAFRQAAGEGHHVGLGGAFILGGKGEPLAIAGDGREDLEARVGGQALGRAAGDGDFPEVALGGEDDGIAVERRGAEEARGALDGGEQGDAN